MYQNHPNRHFLPDNPNVYGQNQHMFQQQYPQTDYNYPISTQPHNYHDNNYSSQMSCCPTCNTNLAPVGNQQARLLAQTFEPKQSSARAVESDYFFDPTGDGANMTPLQIPEENPPVKELMFQPQQQQQQHYPDHTQMYSGSGGYDGMIGQSMMQQPTNQHQRPIEYAPSDYMEGTGMNDDQQNGVRNKQQQQMQSKGAKPAQQDRAVSNIPWHYTHKPQSPPSPVQSEYAEQTLRWTEQCDKPLADYELDDSLTDSEFEDEGLRTQAHKAQLLLRRRLLLQQQEQERKSKRQSAKPQKLVVVDDPTKINKERQYPRVPVYYSAPQPSQTSLYQQHVKEQKSKTYHHHRRPVGAGDQSDDEKQNNSEKSLVSDTSTAAAVSSRNRTREYKGNQELIHEFAHKLQKITEDDDDKARQQPSRRKKSRLQILFRR